MHKTSGKQRGKSPLHSHFQYLTNLYLQIQYETIWQYPGDAVILGPYLHHQVIGQGMHISECKLSFILIDYICTDPNPNLILQAWNFAFEDLHTMQTIYKIIKSGDCPEVPLPLLMWQYAYHFFHGDEQKKIVIF